MNKFNFFSFLLIIAISISARIYNRVRQMNTNIAFSFFFFLSRNIQSQ